MFLPGSDWLGEPAGSQWEADNLPTVYRTVCPLSLSEKRYFNVAFPLFLPHQSQVPGNNNSIIRWDLCHFPLLQFKNINVCVNAFGSENLIYCVSIDSLTSQLRPSRPVSLVRRIWELAWFLIKTWPVCVSYRNRMRLWDNHLSPSPWRYRALGIIVGPMDLLTDW